MENNSNKKSASGLPVRANGLQPAGVCYVEVNTNDIRNVGSYYLATGEQLFDVAIIFAANIGYDTESKQATLYCNPNVLNILQNASVYIQPLQAKGIKVLLTMLGNHQGAGVCNFPGQEAAQAYAQVLANAVTQYGLDGIDFDDEWADYGKNNTGLPNEFSFVYLVTALRELLPGKIISWYFYGPATGYQSYGGVTVGSQINCSWNAMYGSFSPPDVPGLSPAGLAAAAIAILDTDPSTAGDLAAETVKEGYGIFLYYNLPDQDVHDYLSKVSMPLYGQETVYNGS